MGARAEMPIEFDPKDPETWVKEDISGYPAVPVIACVIEMASQGNENLADN